MKGLKLLVLLLCLTAWDSASALMDQGEPWTAYWGARRYWAPWASTVRGNRFGFGGEALMAGRDFIYSQPNGLPGRESVEDIADYMRDVTADVTANWIVPTKNELVDFCSTYLNYLSGENPKTIFFQMGNEIYSEAFRDNLKNWAINYDGKDTAWFDANPDWLERYYVEYYLVPTIEAVNQAKQVFNNAVDLKIVLGSLPNAYRPDYRDWLYRLVNFTVESRLLPDNVNFVGKRVYQIVDCVSIHYFFTQDWHFFSSVNPSQPMIPAAGDDSSAQAMSELYHGLVNPGSKILVPSTNNIKGIVITEELGINQVTQRRASSTAAKIFARWLHWTHSFAVGEVPFSLSSDNVRLSFYAWRERTSFDANSSFVAMPLTDGHRVLDQEFEDPGNLFNALHGYTGGEFMELLLDTFGGGATFGEVSVPKDSKERVPHLVYLNGKKTESKLEAYAFKNLDDSKRIIVLFDHYYGPSRNSQETFALEWLKVWRDGWEMQGQGPSFSYEIYLFDDSGKHLVTRPILSYRNTEFMFSWAFSDRPIMKNQGALVVIMTR